jgi:hypothetical protein
MLVWLRLPNDCTFSKELIMELNNELDALLLAAQQALESESAYAVRLENLENDMVEVKSLLEQSSVLKKKIFQRLLAVSTHANMANNFSENDEQMLEVLVENIFEFLSEQTPPPQNVIYLSNPKEVQGQESTSFEIDDNRELTGAIERALASLRPEEEQALRLRFDIGDSLGKSKSRGPRRTQDEIARKISMSQRSVSSVIGKALRKMKHPSRSRLLRSFVENAQNTYHSGDLITGEERLILNVFYSP